MAGQPMIHVMRLWYFSSSINSFFNVHAQPSSGPRCLTFWSDLSSTSILHVCEQRRLWLLAYVISTIISWASSYNAYRKCSHWNNWHTQLISSLMKQKRSIFFYTLPHKKWRVLCYTIQNFWVSVRPSALRFRTQTWVVFDQLSSNFAWTLI